jgi:hypothetical protein
MGTVVGRVIATPSSRGVPGLIVTVYASSNGAGTARSGEEAARRWRLGSVVTDPGGAFRLEYAEDEKSGRTEARHLLVAVEAAAAQSDDGDGRLLPLARERRDDAAPYETFRFLIPQVRLDDAGLQVAPEPSDDDLLAQRRADREKHERFKGERKQQFVDGLQGSLALYDKHAEGFRAFFERLSAVPTQGEFTSRGFLKPGAEILAANMRVMRESLEERLPHARMATAAVLDDPVVEELKAQFGAELENVPAEAIESVIWPWKKGKPAIITIKFPYWALCGGAPQDDCVKLLEGDSFLGVETGSDDLSANGDMASGGTAAGVDGAKASDDGSLPADPLSISTMVHVQADAATSPEDLVLLAPRATVGDVRTSIESFVLESGPADTPALFDFHHLRIAFEPVWHELFDSDVVDIAQELYTWLAEAGVDPNKYLGGPQPGSINLSNALAAAAQAKASDGNPLHPWVTDEFEITNAEWNALTPDEQQELAIQAGRLAGGGELKTGDATIPLTFDIGLGYPISLTEFFDNSHQYSMGYSGAEINSWIRQEARRCRQIGETIIANARARLTEPSDFDRFHELLRDLDKAMSQPYRFNVYAANGAQRSVNFGIIVNYRQRWEPVTYQVGELVKTIPLAPKETRRFTKKTVVRHSRAEKEVTNSLQAHRTDSTETSRAEAEIVTKAMTRTNFQLGAKGGINIGIAEASGSSALTHETAAESQEVKKEFREAVFKAAEEYKEERTLQIETSDSTEETTEETGELSNPNDEIPVTYLLYQLQRRYRISEELRSATSGVLVAQEMPTKISEAWIVEHDWIIRRSLLDDSFAPALTYLSTKVVGDEVALQELYKNLEQHRKLVSDLKQEFANLQDETQSSYNALQSELQRYADVMDEQGENDSIVPMPVGFITTSDDPSPEAARQRADAARDAYERNAKNLKDFQARLDRETTALATITDTYTKQLSEHLNRRAQIERLRTHIKANIFYYMQAIWAHEPPDQRYMRLRDVKVPRLEGKKTYSIVDDPDATPMPPDWKTPVKLTVHSELNPGPIQFDALGDVADLDNLLGFKGNLMIFPMWEGNDLTEFLMTPYYDPVVHLADPDPLGNWTLHSFVEYVCCLRKALSPKKFKDKLPALAKVYEELKEQGAADEEVVVPTDSLYIEALPGVRPVLEDFKLLHRAVDVKRARAEVRGVELENIRLAARVLEDQLEDPTIEKKIVVEGEGTTIVGGDQ